MSSASETSYNKREKGIQDLEQELEGLRALNSSLQTYLDLIRQYKCNLATMHKNCQQLSKVNTQWIDAVKK